MIYDHYDPILFYAHMYVHTYVQTHIPDIRAILNVTSPYFQCTRLYIQNVRLKIGLKKVCMHTYRILQHYRYPVYYYYVYPLKRHFSGQGPPCLKFIFFIFLSLLNIKNYNFLLIYKLEVIFHNMHT